MLYESRQGEDARRKFANRHYENKRRKKCTAESIWVATYHYIHISQLPTRPYSQASPNINLPHSLHGLHVLVGTAGLRAMVAVYSYGVQEYYTLDERVLSLFSTVSKSATFKILQESKCQVHALPLLQYSSREIGCYGSTLLRYRQKWSACKRWPGSLAVPPISNRQGL